MSKVPPVKAQSYASIERSACGLLRACAPDCLQTPQKTPIEHIVEFGLPRLGYVRFGVQSMLPNEYGYTDPIGRELVLSEETYLRMRGGNGHARFTAGHEAGHAVMHAGQLNIILVSNGRLVTLHRKDIKPYLDPEWQANAFSAALLMPAKMVAEAVDGVRSQSRILRVADKFNVSEPCARIRLEVLELKFGLV